MNNPAVNVLNIEEQQILISSTFISEPIEPYIYYWLKQLNVDYKITFGPYNQIFQQLFENKEKFQNRNIVNVFFIRFEDIIRDSKAGDKKKIQLIGAYYSKLKRMFENLENSSIIIAGIFPIAEHYDISREVKDHILTLNKEWEGILLELPDVYPINFSPLPSYYSVNQIFDPFRDMEGHIPFTDEFYALMGMEIVRKIHSASSQGFKVIVLDCDNTLWRGICGEEEVQVDENYIFLQKFVLQKYNEGMLIALCSKNNEKDVWNVFEKNKGMILSAEKIVAHRINWEPKSENLKSLAHELNLGLDSFIFIDDSHMECLEVMNNCPEVLTLHLPPNMDEIKKYFYHIWAFDRLKITREDKKRSQMYVLEKKRQDAMKNAATENTSLDEFLKDLNLAIWVDNVDKTRAERVSQLTQRTNQFNLSTIRRTKEDILSLMENKEYELWALESVDKYGEYGLTGVLIIQLKDDYLFLDTFLLSCRILGRGIAEALQDLLVAFCLKKKKKYILADYITTEKNKPLLDFMQKGSWSEDFRKEKMIRFKMDPAQYEDRKPAVTIHQNEGFYHNPDNQDDSSPGSKGDFIKTILTPPEEQDAIVEEFDLSIYDDRKTGHSFYIKPLENYPANKLVKRVYDEMPSVMVKKAEYAAPVTETEEKLVVFYSELLKVDHIGREDHFFRLGGNSLKAAFLVSRINRVLGVRAGVVDIFRYPSIKQLADFLESLGKENSRRIPLVPQQEYYDVSPVQNKMLILSKIEGNNISYHIPRVYRIKGSLNVSKLEQAFRELIKRHEILRTHFSFRNGKPVQIIQDEVDFAITHIEPTDKEITRVMDDFIIPFNLEKFPLMRVGLLRENPDTAYLLFDIHHIISDGISLSNLFNELTLLYEGKKLEALPLQYKDLAAWQKSLQEDNSMQVQKEYWVNKFTGEIPVLNLPYDYGRPLKQSFEGNIYTTTLDRGTTNQLKALALRYDATLFMTLLSAFALLLTKYSGQEEVCIGIPVAGRFHGDMESALGVFINTVVLKLFPRGAVPFNEFLNTAREEALKDLSHQQYPFELLVDQLKLKRDLSRNPLFDAMFIMQNMDSYDFTPGNLEVDNLNYHNKSAKLDLTCEVFERDGTLLINFEYCTKLFKPQTIKRLGDNFINLLKAILHHPGELLSALDPVGPEEKDLLLYRFNNTVTEYEKDKTINMLFEDQVKKYPQHLALAFKDITLSYEEVNRKANRIAWRLRKKGVAPGDFVGIMLDRTPDLIISMMGVLKSGGAYLPLDSTYPVDRLDYMLSDSGTNIIVTKGRLMKRISFHGEIIDLEKDDLNDEIEDNPETHFNKNNLAYVIYTSGSTGKPKGVMLEHVNVNNFIKGMSQKIEFTRGKTILALTTVSFDIFVLETLLALVLGLKIYIADEKEQQDSRLLARVIKEKNINILQMTPSRMQLLKEGEGDFSCLRSIESLLVGGEAMPENLLKDLRILKNTRIYNVYGPTETTVWSTVREITGMTKVDIGVPIANTTIYILGKYSNLQPLGVVGELCIGGDGLARGYLNRQELTDEKFINNPLIPGEKIYKTGDLARWLEDGNIECLGRLDHQVKIRGHRIELDEIKSILSDYEGIDDSVVIVVDLPQIGKQLVAYYAGKNEIPVEDLRNYLSDKLPGYMVPGIFIPLEKLPLTLNGKVDRNALPPVNLDRPNMEVEFKEGETEIEKYLSEVWREVLGRNAVGIYDNFFDLGGNSMLVVSMCARLNDKYKDLVDVTDVFANPTIEKLARFIDLQARDSLFSINEFIFPPEYFQTPPGADREASLELTIEPETYNRLCSRGEEMKLGFYELALGSYIYLLSELSDNKNVWIQAQSRTHRGHIVNLNINLEDITELEELFFLVDKKLNAPEVQSYEAAYTNRLFIEKSIHGLCPLFCEETGLGSIWGGTFDILIRIKSIAVIIEYNQGRIVEEEVLKMAEYFSGVLSTMAERL